MMAYAPLYREVEVVLDQAGRHDVPVILISDNLGPLVADKVAEIIPSRVARPIISPCMAAPWC